MIFWLWVGICSSIILSCIHIPIVAIRSDSMLELSINVWTACMAPRLKQKISKLCNSSLLEVVYDI